jgi:hypothetical protein
MITKLWSEYVKGRVDLEYQDKQTAHMKMEFTYIGCKYMVEDRDSRRLP